MSARLEKIENSEAYLEIEVDAATLEEGMEKAYRKVVKQVAIPGFRKGKVPRGFLEAHFGKEILFEDTLEFVVPEAYERALQELEVDPIAQPEFDIDIEKLEPGSAFPFKVRVAVKPEVVLGQLEGLEIKIPKFSTSEDDVHARLDDLRSRYAQLVEKIEAPAEIGDTVVIDFVGTTDGVPFPGGASEGYQLELGSDTFIPGFESQLVGLKAGESKAVEVKFPDNYHADDLKGKEAVFQTTVIKVETKVKRELDDEFAQEISDFDTIGELIDDIRLNLVKAMDMRRDEATKNEAVNKIAEVSQVDIAPAVAEMQLDTILSQLEQRLGTQGISLEQYFQMTKSNVDEFREDMRPQAIQQAKTNFVLEKIIEEKGIDLTDAEIDHEIGVIAQQMGVELEQARQNLEGLMERITYNIRIDKAVQYLVDHAVISVIEPEAGEGEPADEAAAIPSEFADA
ncbi:MAG: trigger factor [Syntrophomonadaceae bacterium]|nr:trigger factor [Syntrophomonadaceae bacterium]